MRAKSGSRSDSVGYDDEPAAFWVHNSWGPEWGEEGYGHLSYDDWIASGMDTWVVDVAPEMLGELEPGGLCFLDDEDRVDAAPILRRFTFHVPARVIDDAVDAAAAQGLEGFSMHQHAAFLADVEADRHELRLCGGVRLCDFGWHGYCSWFVRGTSP